MKNGENSIITEYNFGDSLFHWKTFLGILHRIFYMVQSLENPLKNILDRVLFGKYFFFLDLFLENYFRKMDRMEFYSRGFQRLFIFYSILHIARTIKNTLPKTRNVFFMIFIFLYVSYLPYYLPYAEHLNKPCLNRS